MPVIPLALIAGGAAVQIASGIWSGHKQEVARREENKLRKQDARRQAIERTLKTSFGPSNYREQVVPDLTMPGILGGLGGLASTMGAAGLGGKR